MMPVLGIVDLIAAGVLSLQIFQVSVPAWITIFFVIFLLIKIIAFPFNLAALIDLFAVIFLILTSFGPLPHEFPLAVSGILAIKGAQSLLSIYIF